MRVRNIVLKIMNLNWCVWLYIQGGGWWGCEKAVWMTKVGRVNANFHITLKPWVTLCLANSTGAALYNPTADPAHCTCLEHITCSNKNMKPCGNQTQQIDKNLIITRAEIYKIRQNIPPPLPPLVLTLSRGTPWIEATDELFGRGKVIQRSLHSSTPPSSHISHQKTPDLEYVIPWLDYFAHDQVHLTVGTSLRMNYRMLRLLFCVSVLQHFI